jgi:hypothetical protein
MDVAAIAASSSPEEFFEKEWIRSLFTLAVEDLRTLCETRGRLNTFEIFEEYDLEEAENISYHQLAAKYGIPTTSVTNALAWARREFRRIALERLREVCASYHEFQREVIAVFGKDAERR